MARKPSSSRRGSRPRGSASQGGPARRTRTARRAPDTKRSKARLAGEQKAPSGPTAEQRAADTELTRLRPRDRNVAPSAGGTAETGAERQGMGREHRRNFGKSDDAITRGPTRADEPSHERDSGGNRHSRAGERDGLATRHRFSSRGGHSGRHSDW
jgi:hypothetical protein